MPIHVAITRRVRAGCEEEFQQALREFFRESFRQEGVLGASMIVPPPGSDSREYGILRTFAGEAERDAFYASPLFQAWEQRARQLTEGEPVYRELHGLEAWFCAPYAPPPPRWKMALVTLLGVYPVSLLIGVGPGSWLATLPVWLRDLIVAALIVACLTWLVMPALTKLFHPWLEPHER
ncbi:MAG: antibiotic biosynthesis monooxygenase [Verrucomicrobiae bacterium]|nr:antibiotic biosynthesis monooxygenase [Verrucomicrobiae bacterium]MDW8344015.1 antibiotic biosynthesis monooxygenase [Verrucomicrobiae bacterium]